MSEKTNTSRRDLLIGVAALAGVAGGWQLWIHRTVVPPLIPIDGLTGWRMVEFEGLTAPGNATSAVFAGIGAQGVEPLAPNRLCPVLFRDAGDEIVPIAMFTDAFCPFCRVMEPRLHARRETITFLDLPLLGPASEVAARAAIAAELQGNRAFRVHMMTTRFRPTRRAITSLAETAGADANRLLSDMDSETVKERLLTNRSAAAALVVFGTPALVVGQILAMGNVENEIIDLLIEDEMTQPGPRC